MWTRDGGCDWQHLTQEAQIDAKLSAVEDSLIKLGSIEPPEIGYVAGPESLKYRTTVRVGIHDGRPAHRASRSNDLIPVDNCRVAHPLMDEIFADGFFGAANEATIRVGARTGDRLVMGHPNANDFEMPADVLVVDKKRRAGERRLTSSRKRRELSGEFRRIRSFKVRPRVQRCWLVWQPSGLQNTTLANIRL